MKQNQNFCFKNKCIRCCLDTNMILTYNDIKRINALGYVTDFFIEKKNGWLQLKNHNGKCVFHDGKICLIYNSRPDGCRLYPVVYDKDNQIAKIDLECPNQDNIKISKKIENRLFELINILYIEKNSREEE